MVTEAAAEVVGLCLAPMQSLGRVKQLVMVLKKIKSAWERNILSSISTGTHKIPGSFYPRAPSWRCLSSFHPPCPSQCVCWGAARAGLGRASLLTQLGSTACFTLGVWFVSHHTHGQGHWDPEHPLHCWYSLRNQTRTSGSIKPPPALFVAACRWVSVHWGCSQQGTAIPQAAQDRPSAAGMPSAAGAVLQLPGLYPCAGHERDKHALAPAPRALLAKAVSYSWDRYHSLQEHERAGYELEE